MQSHYYHHKKSIIHYRQYGSGSKLLFCFHGYGRDSLSFSFLEKNLGKDFTMIAIDVPFHGLTEWKDRLVFEPRHLVQLMLDISKDLQKDHLKFNVLGFSMGGRIAFYMTQLIPNKIERLILIAPDGLTFNFWRWLGSETWLGKNLLYFTIHHPNWLKWLVNWGEKWLVMHRSLADFIRYYIHDEQHRKTLYKRWISMSKFSPSKNKLKRLIKRNRIPVRMLFGAFDRVISFQGGEKFRKEIDQFVSVEVLEAGHNLLTEMHAKKITELIND